MKLKTIILLLALSVCAFGQTQRATNFIALNNITAGALTSTRVVYASTGGLLAGSAAFTFDPGTGTLAVTQFSGGGAGVTGVNAATLGGKTFAAPGAIGGGTPSSGAFTTISATGQFTSTLATGTAPLVIASTTQVANLYAARAALADAVTTNANLTGPVTSTGNATAITDGSVVLADMADLAQDQFIGRTTASTGVPQTATITAAARTVLDDVTVAAMVDTLGGASSIGTGGLVRGTSPVFTTAFTLANGTGPTTGAVAVTAFDTDAWAASRGAIQIHDGTANTYVVAALASDTPANGQVPVWNSDGTVTWEAQAGGATLTSTQVGYGNGSNVLTGEAAFTYNASTNIATIGGVSLGAGSEVSTIGPLVDAVDGTTPLNNVVETVATGTAYTLTTTYANVDFGTVDPVIVIPNAGTYMVYALIQTAEVGATATTQVVQAKVRRTNNTAADLGFVSAELLPPGVAATIPGVAVMIVGGKYTTVNLDDSITIQAQLSAALGAGTVTVVDARIWAERKY